MGKGHNKKQLHMQTEERLHFVKWNLEKLYGKITQNWFLFENFPFAISINTERRRDRIESSKYSSADL